MTEPRDRPDLPPEPWSKETAEDVEPDWAQSIRDARKARGDRLRSVFDGFDGQPLKKPSTPKPPSGDAG